MLLPNLESESPLGDTSADPRSALRQQADALEALFSLNPTSCGEQARAVALAAQATGDVMSEMTAAYYLGSVLIGRSETDAAEKQMRRAYELSTAAGDGVWRGRTLAGLGILFAHQAEYDLSLEWLGIALEQYRAIACKPGIADCITNLGNVLSILELHGEALPLLHEARAIDLELGNVTKASLMLWFLAQHHGIMTVCARRQGDSASEREEALNARTLMHQALREDRTGVHPYVETGGLLALANADLVLGDAAAAQDTLNRIDAVLASHPIPVRQVDRDVLWAKLRHLEGRVSHAADALEGALARCDEHHIQTRERIDVLEQLADAREAQGDFAGALQHLRAFQLAARMLGTKPARHRAKLLAQHLNTERERHRAQVQSVLEQQARQPDPVLTRLPTANSF
jgi:tetratricopeptide (TPR) repeat protein